MPINEGDRVKTDTGQTGRVDMIGGFGTVAYVQLEEYTHDVHLTLFQADALTVIEGADKTIAAPLVSGIVNRAGE